MPSAKAARSGWILSPLEDLLWFHGSVAAGLVLLALFAIARHLGGQGNTTAITLLIVFLWGVLFDGTHVWGTYARSYLAPDDASRAALPGAWSWGLLIIGPAIALVAAALHDSSLFGFFVLVAYLWAYWHLVRQHYGFLMLYRKRSGETDPRGARLDAFILWLGCLYPYFRFSLGAAYLQSGLPQLMPMALIAPARLALGVTFGLAAAIAIAVVVSQRIEPLRLGPKHLLMAIVIAFHLLVFSLLDNLLAILATLTIFHNLQYHRIVWLYERGVGRTPSGGLARYLGFGIALGAVWYGTRVLGAAAADSDTLRNVFIGLGWGVAFHHYLVDGRIWHVRRSQSVAHALQAA